MNRQYGALSGAAIVLIAVNHAVHYGLQLSPVVGAWRNVLILLQALGAFAVPTFLFVSGAFLSYSAGQLSLQFVRSNLGRILWPYAIWSTLFYVFAFATGEHRASTAGYVKDLLVGYPYHFIPLLIFCYLTAPLMVKIGRRHGVALLVTIALLQALLLVVRYPGVFGGVGVPASFDRVLRVPVLFTSLSDWAIYFPLGLVMGIHAAVVKPRLTEWRWAAVGLAACLFAVGILDAMKLISAPWARFVAHLPLMFLLPVVSRQSIPWVQRLEFLGKRSYGIYLVHFLAVNVTVWFLGGLDLGARSLLVVIPGLLLVALTLPLLLMEGMARFAITRGVYRYIFGFAPPAVAERKPLRRDIPVPAEH